MKKEMQQNDKEQDFQHIIHPFEPFFNAQSKILIIGSFPSVASRADGFYYGNPHNRFWKVLAAIFKDNVPIQISEKKDFLNRHKIALYDSINECTISGSSDSSIRNVVPSDIKSIVQNSQIKKIFANGKTAEKFFIKYQNTELCAMLKALPSTSPANAAFSLGKLLQTWKVITDD